ncbi:SixA phosphatase family protein [Sphingobacterium deserti]|nr:histidine phosphatase family protein [Sphingobacterium deserti]
MDSKKLYIIRHGKAEEHSFSKEDFNRDLVEKGIARSLAVAEKIKTKISPIDKRTLIISSTANRAAQTARIFAQSLGYPEEEIVWEPTIYEAHYLHILKRLNQVSANYDRVLLFGHNPGLSDLIDYIANEYINLKTSYAACLTLEEGLDYSTLSANTARLEHVIEE